MTHEGHSLDAATAYFTVQGFRLIADGLRTLGSFRLLIGSEPESGRDLGLRPREALRATLRADLETAPFDEGTLRTVEDLIAYLQRENVAVRLYGQTGFLHAKCFLFYSYRPGQQRLFERFRPVIAIIGSSNLTGPGLTSNRELNLAHKVLLDPAEAEDPEAQRAVGWLTDQRPSDAIKPVNRQLVKSEVGARAIIELERWFESRWQESQDFKQDLVEMLDASKFGRTEYTPYQVYMKALFEYFRDELQSAPTPGVRSAVDSRSSRRMRSAKPDASSRAMTGS